MHLEMLALKCGPFGQDNMFLSWGCNISMIVMSNMILQSYIITVE